ncbi:hypothetical protein, partial [Mycolicibacterium fortuitum]|uniref:hypothetical protein n=1 Tax=Mycolicibacterium fortuitum TaxID=1766 RepID=UPI001A9769CA
MSAGSAAMGSMDIDGTPIWWLISDDVGGQASYWPRRVCSGRGRCRATPLRDIFPSQDIARRAK